MLTYPVCIKPYDLPQASSHLNNKFACLYFSYCFLQISQTALAKPQEVIPLSKGLRSNWLAILGSNDLSWGSVFNLHALKVLLSLEYFPKQAKKKNQSSHVSYFVSNFTVYKFRFTKVYQYQWGILSLSFLNLWHDGTRSSRTFPDMLPESGTDLVLLLPSKVLYPLRLLPGTPILPPVSRRTSACVVLTTSKWCWQGKHTLQKWTEAFKYSPRAINLGSDTQHKGLPTSGSTRGPDPETKKSNHTPGYYSQGASAATLPNLPTKIRTAVTWNTGQDSHRCSTGETHASVLRTVTLLSVF